MNFLVCETANNNSGPSRAGSKETAMGDEENTKRKRNLPKYLSDYVGVPGQNSDKTESTSVTSSSRHSSKQGSRTSKNTSTTSRERARQAAREANLAKPKVEQLKEKARLEVEIAAQKA